MLWGHSDLCSAPLIGAVPSARGNGLGGAVPAVIHRGEAWQRPDRSVKALPGAIEQRLFPDTRVTACRMAA